jgi:exopolysaccharide biosynthesis polyprenyl glycosylphosphotransferase
LIRFCREELVNQVIFEDAFLTDLKELVVRLMRQGIRTNDLVGFCEQTFFKTPANSVGASWLILADTQVLRHSYRAIKRAMDIFVSAIGIILTLPLWGIIALLIKISDRGPVFYSQTRVGRSGNHFKILKFRTMRPECENNSGPLWASCNDQRITGLGRILRKTRLDELPQFLNVLKGHMSVVGPRPERPEFVSLLKQSIPNYDLRHLLRPGITGWAQINFRYGSSVTDSEEKLCYDLYYVKHGGFWLDMYILVLTIGHLMTGSR